MLVFSVSGQLLSAGVTFICSYMTICFCEQVRLCKAEAHRPKFLNRHGLFFAMALMTGFGARFAPNLITYNTMTAEDADGMDLDINVNIPPIIGALFISVFSTFLGLYVGSLDKMFAKTKEQIVEMFVEDSKKLSFKQIQNISPLKMFFLLSTKSWFHLAVGGVIQGSGVIILRCLFIYAVEIDDTHFVWNGGIIFASILVSWLVNILCLWVMFRLTSLYPEQEWLRLLGACLQTGGSISAGKVVSTAVTMVTFYDPSNPNVKPFLSNSQTSMLAVGLVSSICFAFILMIIGFCDLRSWLYQTSSQVHKYEVLIAKIKKEYPVTVDSINTYIRKHDSLASRHASDSSQHASQLSTRASSLVVSPTLKYFISGAFLGRNVVTPGNDSRNRSVNRSVHRSRNHSSSKARSDIESRGEDDGPSTRSPEKVTSHTSEISNRAVNKNTTVSQQVAAQKAASMSHEALAIETPITCDESDNNGLTTANTPQEV